MQIEAFSVGKIKADPSANEDNFLVLPGLGFAVIDGLSDRTGHRYDGLSAGQMASQLVVGELAQWLVEARCNPALELVERLTKRLRDAYVEYGIVDVAIAEPGRRFGATLALAIDLGDSWRFILIGDSGIRLNASEILQNDHPVDIITSALRSYAFKQIQSMGGDLETASEIGRLAAFHGGTKLHPDMQSWLTIETLATIRAAAKSDAVHKLPAVPESDIDILLDQGILDGQGQFQNNTNSPMSYAVLDGTTVPMQHVRVIERARSTISSIELFSDGYIEPAQDVTIHDWEASFKTIEAKDPGKIDAYPCPKGSTKDRWFDDRTVLIVKPTW